MALVLLKSDDTSPATSLVFSANAGAESATQTFHLWFNQGTPGGTISDVFLQLEVDNGSGTYVIAGVAMADQRWFKARVASGSNPSNDPAYIAQTTDWYDLGTDSVLPIPPLVGNSARYIEVKLRAPLGDGAATTTSNFRLVPRYNEATQGMAGGVSGLGQGIISGIGDATAFEFTDAPLVHQTGVADDYSHVLPPTWDTTYNGIIRGVYYSWAAHAHQYTQLDGAASALTAGQVYIVTISQGTGATPTYTKGIRAASASAVAPAAPASEILIGTVRVRYTAGTTEILTSDITVLCFSGRFRVEAGSGLHAIVNPGRAILPGAFVSRTSQQNALLVNTATNWIWLSASGGLIVTQTATPPQIGVEPLASMPCAGGIISGAITDLRRILWPNGVYGGIGTSVALGTAGAVSMDVALGDIFTITPTADVTLNAVNVKSAQLVSVYVTTSGTAPFKITFGTGFSTRYPAISTGSVSGVKTQLEFRGGVDGKLWEERDLVPAAVVLGDTGTVSVDAALGDVFTLTPVNNVDLELINGVIGQTIVVEILTSGTTPYQVTFGSGFSTTYATVAMPEVNGARIRRAFRVGVDGTAWDLQAGTDTRIPALNPADPINIDATTGDVFTLTPNQNATMNITGTRRAGQVINVLILTSGASSYTVTMGNSGMAVYASGSRALVTGVTSGVRYAWSFVCDGTDAWELTPPVALGT